MKKRLISLLLLAVMMLSVLAGCGGNSEQTSSDNTSVPNTPVNNRIEEVDAILKDKIDRKGMLRTPISIGKDVTASRDANGSFSILTDNRMPEKVSKNDTVGFEGKEDVSLILDLGETVSGIGDFGVSIVSEYKWDASLPREVIFSVSADGEHYVQIGTVYRPREVLQEQGNLYLLSLQKGVDVRYVKATVVADGFMSDNLYFDEFAVYALKKGVAATGKDMLLENYYENEPLPEVTENLYHNSSDSDYNTVANLVAKMPYRIKADFHIEEAQQTNYYNSPTSNPALTDGKIATSTSYDASEYFHFTRSVNRTVIFDLEKISGVSGISIGYLSNEPTGIYPSVSVEVKGSLDGKAWGELGIGNPQTTKDTPHRLKFELDFDKTAVRFVAVTMSVASHVWLDEIEVYGTKNASDAKELVTQEETDNSVGAYLSPDALGGTENIMLMYTFKNENPETGLNTVEEILPYVAYLDKNKEIKDSFFDAFLFLPCSTTCPSGGKLYYSKSAPSIMSDWLAFEDDLFAENHNVNALQTAVEQLDEALGTDTEMPVYFSIFSTIHKFKGFGDVDGDGKNEDFTNAEDRKKVLKWWIDHLIARFESGNYSKLRLDGFYWYHEAMELADPHEVELVHYVADYLHSLGYYFIWIPYYQATGYADWKSYGFDAAVMQPNYMFNDDVPEERLYYNAEYTKSLGLGVEIEADYGVATDPAKLEKYRAYLCVGVETGYMNSIKMYYQDGGPGVLYKCCNSSDSVFRSAYDDTYKYAKGTLTTGLPALKQTTFEGESGENLQIRLQSEGSVVTNAGISAAPLYGSVKEGPNGSFVYYPHEGFVGTDTFEIKPKNVDNAESIVITVVISEAEE